MSGSLAALTLGAWGIATQTGCRQAEADRRHARNSLEAGDYEWACFAAQQATEKAMKAVVQRLDREPWGHSVTVVIGGLGEKGEVPPELVDAGKRLDKHYIPARSPNGFDVGAPTDYYTREEARTAIADALGLLQLADQMGTTVLEQD